MGKSNIIGSSVNLISSAIVGTSAMTLYSYIRSGSGDKNFREPQNLNVLLKNLNYNIPNPRLAGWILHYKVGFGFAAAYNSLRHKLFRPSLLSGIIFGGIGGIIGIATWDMVLRKHPHPPTLDRKAFYQHLFIAHLIFGAFAEVGNRSARPIR